MTGNLQDHHGGHLDSVSVSRDHHVAYHHQPTPSVILTSRSPPPPPPPQQQQQQTTASTASSPHKPRWNTSNLAWRVTSDLTAAGCAAGLVAPLITMIDRGIIERASTCKPLRESLRESMWHLLTRPHLFLSSRPFLLIAGLYFGTYATANTTDTITNTVNDQPASKTNTGPAKFAATSAMNMSLCLYKDSQFTRMFSGSNPAGAAAAAAVPKASYALFALRDSMTVFASFNVPPRLAPLLPGFTAEIEQHVSRASAAQFMAPAAMQLLSTPLHLLGLDLYNRPASRESVGWRDRVRVVRRDWLGCSFARMGRIVPAFGVGGVVNAEVRKRMIGTA